MSAVPEYPPMRIGVDLGGTKIEACALDSSGEMRWRRRAATPAGDYPATLNVIRDLVQQAESDLHSRARIGVGTPGSLSPTRGVIRNANSTCLNDRPLHRDLEVLLEREIRIANDADCFALSEATDGAGQGAHSVFGVIIGTGTGGGLVYRGQLLAGVNAICGEWGHNPLPWPNPGELPGPACYCGKRGCIETFLSGPGLLADYRHNLSQSDDDATRVEEIVTQAHSGNRLAQQALQRHSDRLARALASVINLFDPEVIVLGGGLSNLAHLYDELPGALERWVFSDALTTRILPPLHGDSSGVRGAAWLWPAEEP